ncbi:hypothetical protein VE04_06509 [Pseudogymnoascus sp. 24MN13]|nr:hypothetical protein VE04_06509 [Pseudogymnoascus sp. 24MN13]
MENPWISLDQDLLAELNVLVIPKAKTLSSIMNEHFPDSLAISFISHQILIELIKVTFGEHCRRLAYLPGGFWDTNVRLRYYNGPIHGPGAKRPKPNTNRFHDEYNGTDYLKSQGCFQPGSMMSFGEDRMFTAGTQVKKKQISE